LNRDFLTEDKRRCKLLGLLPERLPFLWTIDAIQANAFRLPTVQDFEGVAVEDAGNGTDELPCKD
jgi:hypothetical protein